MRGAGGNSRISPVQQDQRLPRDRDGSGRRKARTLHSREAGIAAGVGKQQHLVGMTKAKPGPCGVASVGGKVYRAVPSLDVVDIAGERVVAFSRRLILSAE